MPVSEARIILGSRSPRRWELLALMVPERMIELVPPRNTVEEGFEDCRDRAAIHARLVEITRAKGCDVLEQVRGKCSGDYVVIAADTEIVVTDPTGDLRVLGQPPDDAGWRDVVRRWFREYYAGRVHWAMTALCVQMGDGRSVERLVETEVEFRPDVDRWLDWYLATEESRGKAGGYGLQGAGSVFVSRVTGSLSNVIGLPLEALGEALETLGVGGKRSSNGQFSILRVEPTRSSSLT